MPLSFVVNNEEIPEHSEDAADVVSLDPEWLKKLFRANHAWDNELFSDGMTTVSGVDAALLPAELARTRRYPELLLVAAMIFLFAYCGHERVLATDGHPLYVVPKQ